ncbi:hypothetical protein WJX74_009033 [Apatococcus lobatus]|uniref:Conserved oligomeric Golgi complex subunit 5 n=1 Tax=Apatococcus lobatus TaxID=904363 RepID=A0AAW1S4M3_9CHLO
MGKGGQQADTASPVSLREDPRYRAFFQDGFNPATFASQALAGPHSSAQATVTELQDGLRALDLRIREEVLEHHAELVQQSRHIQALEAAMQSIGGSVSSLQDSIARAQQEVREPYTAVAQATRQLTNLHATVTLLRNVLQRLRLIQRLHAMSEASPATSPSPAGEASASAAGRTLDLAKAAKLLGDIKASEQEADLSGVDVIDAEQDFLREVGQQVREQAQAALAKGMQSLSQADVGSTLQVFFNLDELTQVVDGMITERIQHLQRAAAAALDSRKLTAGSSAAASAGLLGGHISARSATAGTTGSPARMQEALWHELGRVREQAHTALVAIWHLQRVLAKKRDPLTHACFLDVVLDADGRLPCDRMWQGLVEALRESMVAAASSRGGFVRDALTGEFPRLAVLLENLLQRLKQDTSVRGVMPGVQPEGEEQLLQAAQPFQSAYLASVLSSMSDAVTLAFPGGNRPLPTAADLQKCIGRVHEQLKAVTDSPRLVRQVASQVNTALQLLAERAEYMSARGPEVRSAGGSCTGAQQRNLALCSQLQEVFRSLLALLPRLPDAASGALQAALESIQNVAVEAVMPIFRAMVEAAEQQLLAIHTQNFGGKERAGGVINASPYMLGLAAHIAHCRTDYLSRLTPAPSASVPSFGATLVQRMASRLLMFFVRHASLLRPLSHAGKLQLARDMAELEMAIGQSLFPLEALGRPLQVLRAFRPLLFLDTASLPDSPLLAELPASVVLHHLFSRAPAELKSPHARSNITPAQYSLWLDDHSRPETLRGVRAALDACAPAAKGQPGFDDVYPLMLKLASAE